MALYPRLANHVFDTFDAFKEWMTDQQYDIIVNPKRQPILKKGQKVFIKDTGIVYGVVENILDVADVLATNDKGTIESKLRSDQNYIFRLFSPAIPVLHIYPKATPGKVDLYLGQTVVAQNTSITLKFEKDNESFNKTTYLTILTNGGVTINSGKFIVDCWTGEGNIQYRPDSEITPNPNSTYAFIVKNSELVYMIEVGRTIFSLEQEIPFTPGDAATDKGPSVQAVSKSLAELRDYMDKAIKESTGFLVYCGIDPATNLVAPVKEDSYVVDIMYATNTEKELPIPIAPDNYSLVLKNQSFVRVFKSKTLQDPVYLRNSLYLGEGEFGNAEEAPNNIQEKYPSARVNAIVSNLDTGTEWKLTNSGWKDTYIPNGDSEYAHTPNYLGVYNPSQDTAVQSAAINMVYPLSENGDIVYNKTTDTEWQKKNNTWSDTKQPIGTSPTTVENSAIIGTFEWDPTNDDQVRAVLTVKYADEDLETGDLISVQGGNEWIYDKDTNSWTNTGEPNGTNSLIENPQYLATGNYGEGGEAENILAQEFEDPEENDCVGNLDTNTDWVFNGESWVDTEMPLGTYSKIFSPAYKGTFFFDKDDSSEVAAAMSAVFPKPFEGAIAYNDTTGTEWTYSKEYGWTNTYRTNLSTPEEIPNKAILGDYTYLEYWTPPSRTLRLLYPNAKGNSFVYNISTGTKWKLISDTLTWINTKEPIGEIPEDNPLYLGMDAYRTNPPTDEYILEALFPNANNGNFVWNLNSDSYWELVRSKWIDTGSKNKTRFLLREAGIYRWEEIGDSKITAGNMFHLLSRGEEASKSEVYWFANTWNMVDFETITVPQFSNDLTGTIKGSKGWGYVEAVEDSEGNTVGKVVGITNTGDGSRVLTDSGEYRYLNAVSDISSDTDIYINQELGNDEDSGMSSDRAWKTTLRLAQWLKDNAVTFEYNPDKKDYPKRVTLHIEGNAPDKDLFLDGIPYLNVVGLYSENPEVYPCKMLHITNSSVTLTNIACRDRIIAWKSKLKTDKEISCRGLRLVCSQWEQEDKSNIIFDPVSDKKVPVIQVDADSTMYHSAKITTNANLYTYTPFLQLEGRYIKGALGVFISEENPRPGVKFEIKPTCEIIGTNLEWMTENIPYGYLKSVDTDTPHVFPSVQTAYGTEEKSGFKIGTGKDLIDVIKDKLIKDTPVFNSLEEVYALPDEERYVGKYFYIKNKGGYYYFRDGIANENVKEWIAPVYNIQYRVPVNGLYNWLNVFPFANVDEQGWLTDEPIYGEVFKPITWNTKI